MATSDAMVGPKPPALQAAPSGDFWNETQWAVLASLMDAFVPSFVPESRLRDRKTQVKLSDAEYMRITDTLVRYGGPDPSQESFDKYMRDTVSDHPAAMEGVRRTLAGFPSSSRKELGGVLALLARPAGAFLLTGYCTPVHQQPVFVREAIIRRWCNSWIPTMQLLARAIGTLAALTWTQTSPVLRQVMGWSDVPREWKATAAVDYAFMQFDGGPEHEEHVVETDVVIVGSGPGGGVCAKVLAEAGYRVVVVDKGYHFPAAQLPMPQEAASRFLYENGGVVPSLDTSVNVLAGSSWGGGGSINWSVSLQPQDYVRREWAQGRGLPFFETPQFQECGDRVCETIGVSEQGFVHNRSAAALLDGADLLGWKAKVAPQNSGGEDHWCGSHCHLGCGSGGKRGPAVTWLPAAAKAGARSIEGFQVDRVRFDGGDPTKKARSIVGTWTSRDQAGGVTGPMAERTTRTVVVKAKKVIVSCGTLGSPLLLQRSGLKVSFAPIFLRFADLLRLGLGWAFC